MKTNKKFSLRRKFYKYSYTSVTMKLLRKIKQQHSIHGISFYYIFKLKGKNVKTSVEWKSSSLKA